jgi:hypothetical protein
LFSSRSAYKDFAPLGLAKGYLAGSLVRWVSLPFFGRRILPKHLATSPPAIGATSFTQALKVVLRKAIEGTNGGAAPR